MDAIGDALTCGVVLCGDGGRVLDANRAAADLLGLTREQLLGRTPVERGWRALDEDGRALLPGALLATLAHAPPQRFRFGIARAAPGPLAWIRGDSAPVAVAPYRVVCTLVDVSREPDPAGPGGVAAELQAARRLERLQAVRSTAMAINASHDLRVTLDLIVRLAALHLGVSAAAAGLLDEAGDSLEYVAGVGFRRAASLRWRTGLPQDSLRQAVLDRRPLWIDDMTRAPDGPSADLAAEEGFVSHVAVPLVARGQLAGVLELFHRHRLQPDGEWAEFMETLAEQAAVAIETHRLRLRLGPGQPEASPLRAIEEELLRLAATGCSNRTIAQHVFLSENTVKFHLRRIYRQLGVHTRTEAVVAATTRGWI